MAARPASARQERSPMAGRILPGDRAHRRAVPASLIARGAGVNRPPACSEVERPGACLRLGPRRGCRQVMPTALSVRLAAHPVLRPGQLAAEALATLGEGV